MSGDIQGQFNIGNALTQMGQNQQNALTTYADLRARNMANQQTASQMAAQADWQKAYDPTTGQYSPQKYNALVAADPAARYAAQDATQAGQANLTSQLANQGAQIKNAYSKVSYLADMATGYAENQPSAKQMQSDFADGINQGLIDPTEGAQILSMVPSDPTQAAAWWKNEAQHLSANAGQIARFLPAATPIGAGGQTIMGQGNPLAPGYTAPGSVVTNTPSAEFFATPQTITLPDGSQLTGTPAQIQARMGGAIPQASIAPPGGASQGAPSGYGPQGLAPIGAPPGPGPQSAGAPVAPAPAAQGGGVVVPAGAQASAASLATDQTGAYSQDVQTATNTAPVMSSITELAAAAKGFKPGPISGQVAQLSSLAQELGLPVPTDAASAEQTASKASGMILSQNLSGFGPSTDAKLGAAMGITPNGTMSGEGLAATAAMTAGAKLYQLRLGQAAQQWRQQGGNPADPAKGYNSFKLQFQNETSPLVLALPYMPASQIKDLATEIKTLPGDQQRAIDAQIKTSMKNGWLSAPGQ